ncbi:P-loop containing nucleoside triphosphate hydrolase protein [Mycena floridula]|nr:P-loop containing nucleoside triphosphate hydrolase protein [Mycena floridula]
MSVLAPQPANNDFFAEWFTTFSFYEEAKAWVLRASLTDLKNRITQLPSLQPLLPTEFLLSLSGSDLKRAFRYIFVCWRVTNGCQCPTQLQLRAALAAWHKKDVFVIAGTGRGKTLAGMLNQLLEPGDGVTLVLSPLKRLQSSQAYLESFYSLKPLIVNEDTPRELEFWNQKVHNIRKKQAGSADVIIATPEQFFRTPEGHSTKLGDMVRHKLFKRRIKLVIADEIHQLVTQGLPNHGLPPFRPCYGRLDELKALLGDDCPWMVLTATAPLYMVKSIDSRVLRPNYINIRVTSNRFNTVYASHCIVGTLKDFNNFLCFLKHPFDFKRQPWVLIFIENSEQTVDLARFLDRSLPAEYQNKGIVKHYHSSMSSGYLNLTHESFISEDGQCKVLVTTSAESTGIDFPRVDITCVAGLRRFTVDTIQSYGRIVRRPGTKGLAVNFYEPWVSDIDLNEYDHGDLLDLDRPRSLPLRPKASVQEQSSFSAVSSVKSGVCKRKYFAEYLNDTSVESLTYVTDYCCDAHDKGFELQMHLPGPLYVSPPAAEPAKKVKSKIRPPKQRDELETSITRWLHTSFAKNRVFGRQIYHILTNAQIKTLLRPPAGIIACKKDITALLKQSKDWEELWGESLMAVIAKHDKVLVEKLHKKAERAQEIAERKATVASRKRPRDDEAENERPPRRTARMPNRFKNNGFESEVPEAMDLDKPKAITQGRQFGQETVNSKAK